MMKKTILLCAFVLFAFNQSLAQRKAILPRPNSTHSPAILVGDTLYLAGQGSRNPETGQHPEGMEAATRQAMLNLKRVLDAAGFSYSDVVSTNVWMTDITKFEEMNTAYRSFFEKGDLPTRTTIAVPALPGGSTVEIAMVAVKGPYPGTPPFVPTERSAEITRAGKGERKAIYLPGVERGKRPYSPGVLIDGTLYISGQASVDPATGKLVEGDIAAHVTQTLKNIERILQTVGLDFSNVVATQVFLTNMDNFEEMNKVYRSFTKSPRPVRATVGASALPGGPPVEITMTASRKTVQEILPEGMTPSSNFSRGLVVGDTVYLAGVAGRGETIQDQVRYCIGELEKVLKTAGLTLGNVADSKVYLTDIKDYTAMNEVYKTYFPNEPPARSTVAIPDLVGDSKVEIIFTARK